MKNVYYPLAGMNYIIDDMAQIIENKMEDEKEIVLWLSAQVNSYPHIGTLTNYNLCSASNRLVRGKDIQIIICKKRRI